MTSFFTRHSLVLPELPQASVLTPQWLLWPALFFSSSSSSPSPLEHTDTDCIPTQRLLLISLYVAQFLAPLHLGFSVISCLFYLPGPLWIPIVLQTLFPRGQLPLGVHGNFFLPVFIYSLPRDKTYCHNHHLIDLIVFLHKLYTSQRPVGKQKLIWS